MVACLCNVLAWRGLASGSWWRLFVTDRQAMRLLLASRPLRSTTFRLLHYKEVLIAIGNEGEGVVWVRAPFAILPGAWVSPSHVLPFPLLDDWQDPSRPRSEVAFLGSIDDWARPPHATVAPSTPPAATVVCGCVTADGLARDLLVVGGPAKLLVWDLTLVMLESQASEVGLSRQCSTCTHATRKWGWYSPVPRC